MAPYAGPSSGGQRWDGGASYQAQEQQGPFTADMENVTVTVDPQLGPIAIGAYAPHGKPAVLRAWDMKAKKPLWEQLSGQSWVENLEAEHVRIIGRSVYVAHKRQLFCLDLANGNRRWQVGLSDAPEGDDDDGLMIADPFNPGGRGAILVPTIDHQIFAIDRDSGQVLWNRPFGDSSLDVQPVAGLGACIVRSAGSYVKVDIINPAYPQSIARLGDDHWSTDLGQCRVSGRTVVTVVDDMGAEGDDDGLLCFDAVTGQRHFFDKVDDLEEDIVPCAIGPRAFAAMDDGAALYVGPRGRAMPVPVPNHKIVAMTQAGPTLVLLLTKAQGTPIRRIVGIEPNSLAFRFDSGEAGTEPDDRWHRQMQSDGYSLVFAATPNDDLDSAELRSVDTTTGRQLWSRPARRYRSHRFVNGAVVMRSWNGFEVLQPQSGQPIASLG